METNGKTNKKKSNPLFMVTIVIQLIILAARIPLTRVIGDEGNGIYAAAFQFYIVILILTTYCIPDALGKLLHARMRREQYRNASHVFRFVLLWSFCVSAVMSLVLFFAGTFLCEQVLLVDMSTLALKMLIPALCLSSFVSVLRGYFQGLGTMMPTGISKGVEVTVAAVTGVIVSMFTCNYGIKAAHLLHNNSFAAAYAVVGVSIGVAAGLLVSLVFLGVLYLAQRKSQKSLLLRDKTRGSESAGDILKAFLYVLSPAVVVACIHHITPVLDQILFYHVMTGMNSNENLVVEFGIYAGKYVVLMEIPIVLASFVWLPVIPALQSAYQKIDLRLIRNKVAAVYRLAMVAVLPCFVILTVLNRPILNMLFRGDVTKPAMLIRYGSALLLFTTFSQAGSAVLQGIGKTKRATVHTLLAIVLHIVVLIPMLSSLKLGITGVVYANMIMEIVLTVLHLTAIKKYLKYSVNWIQVFLFPAIPAVVTGAAAFFGHMLLNQFLGNVPAVVLSLVVSFVLYGVLIVKLRVVRKKELRLLPLYGVLAR